MKRVLFPALLLLAACGTPQEQCISNNTRDLRTVERLIAESETNLNRGYAVERETVYMPSMRPCWAPGRPTKNNPNPAPVMRYCDVDVAQTFNRPVAIDLEAEADKLRQLKAKQRELSRRATEVVAQCRQLYPE